MAKPGSEHDVASRITFASLRAAFAAAVDFGIDVDVRAVVLPGDEPAVEAPIRTTLLLGRTVQSVASLAPRRPLPLISDILRVGSAGATSTHLIYTNVDIGLQRTFYVDVARLVKDRFGPDAPFVIYRRNISDRFQAATELHEIYREKGAIAYGHDCFVFPTRYQHLLDLGLCCIGAPHFDYLMSMALDRASGFRMARVDDIPLTFHLGNAIGWARNLDYVEHNLKESLDAIERMKGGIEVPSGCVFATIEKNHFMPNARLDSRILRKVKRIPGIGALLFRAKRLLGRSH